MDNAMQKATQNAILQEHNLPIESHFDSTHITIQIENRMFRLSLENLSSACRKKILSIFAQKQYTLEELLTLFVTILRDQSLAEQELQQILYSLKQ